MRAAEHGVFPPDERLELVGGDILGPIPPISPAHATAICTVGDAVRLHQSPTRYLRTRMPLYLSEDSMPEPEIALVDGDPRDYTEEHPRTAILVAEVSVASPKWHRTYRANLYASAGIPEYWIVNLHERLLEVHRNPAASPSQPFGHGYRSIQRLTEAETVAPRFAPDIHIAVADLLP